MNIKKKTKRKILWILLCFALVLFIYNASNKTFYASNDPLNGSFCAKNIEVPDWSQDGILASVEVAPPFDFLIDSANDKGLDISSGCWVYMFSEKEIYKAKKNGNVLEILNDQEVIGSIERDFTKLFCFEINESFVLHFKNTECPLKKVNQGFIG